MTMLINGLKLASNFSTFFDTLCETLDQLAADFPRFTEVYDSLSRGGSPFSQRLPEALVKFYACIFDFFHSISRVFTRKDGSKNLNLDHYDYII